MWQSAGGPGCKVAEPELQDSPFFDSKGSVSGIAESKVAGCMSAQLARQPLRAPYNTSLYIHASTDEQLEFCPDAQCSSIGCVMMR